MNKIQLIALEDQVFAIDIKTKKEIQLPDDWRQKMDNMAADEHEVHSLRKLEAWKADGRAHTNWTKKVMDHRLGRPIRIFQHKLWCGCSATMDEVGGRWRTVSCLRRRPDGL